MVAISYSNYSKKQEKLHSLAKKTGSIISVVGKSTMEIMEPF